MGGASAVGCGAFGLVGLLVSVGLTVYLGSRVTSSVDGGGGRIETLTSEASALANTTVPGLDAGGARLAITAPSDLPDGATVTVGGRDLVPGELQLTTCLTHGPRSADGAVGCDPTTTVAATVDRTGGLSQPYAVHRVVTVAGQRYDCAAFVAACVVVAHRPGAVDAGVSAALAFPVTTSPAASVPPRE